MSIEDFYQHEVVTALGDTNLIELGRLMKEKNVGCIIIIDKKSENPKPVGILTDRDIALHMSSSDKNLSEIKAEEVMQKDLMTLKKSQSPKEALVGMRKHSVRRAPVVDGEGKLLGIISSDDLFSYCVAPLVEFDHLIKHQISQTHCSK